MSWFQKLIPTTIRTEAKSKKGVPEGLWTKCKGCEQVLFRAELSRHLDVCPKCSHHHRIAARRRLEIFLDKENRREIPLVDRSIDSLDKLKFKDSKKYKDRLSSAQKKTGEKDAMVVFEGTVNGLPVVACAFDFTFLGGSMGAAVGGGFTQGAHQALATGKPFICFSASGGARMQEGLMSLMQMSKTSAALGKLREAGLPFISVLTDPTTGGVSASLAMLGDLNIAEPNALIGFAGPRVIEQTVRQKLPQGFQRSEFVLEHGAVDMIVDRRELRDTLTRLVAKFLRKPTPESTQPAVVQAEGEE